jgi:guanylate kinase
MLSQPGKDGATGILFVISAPSGTGKSTVAARLVEMVPKLQFSVSYTTRQPRKGEADGREYRFVDGDTFARRVEQGAFLEWARVYAECYGTGAEETRSVLDSGQDVLLDIDIQGARRVRGGPIPAVAMMVLPPDYATLESRLRLRNSEPAAKRELRLAEAREEIEAFDQFDYMVVNDEVEPAAVALASIIAAERRRTVRCRAEARRILTTFPKKK